MRYKEFWIALGLGALGGGIAALLYAPQSGRKTRKQIKRNLVDAGEALEEAGDYLKAQADLLAMETQKLIDQGKGQLGSAVDAAADYAQTAGKYATEYAETASKFATGYAQTASETASKAGFKTASKMAKKLA